MSKITFTYNGLEELTQALDKVSKRAPDIILKYTTKAGNRFKKDVKEETDRVLNRYRGNLIAGYRNVVELKHLSGADMYEAQVSGGNRKARHFHLLEHGHRRYENYFFKPHYGNCHSFAGFTQGYHMMEHTQEKWEREPLLVQYGEMAVVEAIKKGGFEL